MTNNADSEVSLWQEPPTYLLLIALGVLALVWSFSDGLAQMVKQWDSSEEYGYGYMMPVLTAFFIWQLKNELAKIEFSGSWLGVAFLVFGGTLLVMGDLATLFTVVQYAFLVALFGFALAIMGRRAFKMILPALFLLVFMIPLPGFLYQGLSAQLQLISSQLGVEVIRLFGISVFLEGNVIDLGAYKLQVVEACSGLRYLFPLAALSYMSAYLFKGALWKKVIIFISSAPITVLMNSFRIGVIGVLVEYWGISMAEGFLHDFEGWFVFMACMLVLILEMWVLSKIGNTKIAFADVFELTLPEKIEGDREIRKLPRPLIATIPILLMIASIPFLLSEREEVVPERDSFVSFPMKFNKWEGRYVTMQQQYIDVLQFDDYFMANYSSDTNNSINLYIAYYESQRKGASIHSPRSCIPGGGWQIVSHQASTVSMSDVNTPVNKLVIQKGSHKQLVYYWFDQRGRKLTNEYIVKWYLFWDALTMNRTDGALVRVTSYVKPGQDMNEVESDLKEFINNIALHTEPYIPG